MANLLDYLDWRGDLTLTQSKLNTVDLVCFTQLAILDYRGLFTTFNDINTTEKTSNDIRGCDSKNTKTCGSPQTEENVTEISLKKLYQAYRDAGRLDKPLGAIVPFDINLLIKKMAESKRFADVTVRSYVCEIDKDKKMQFSAVTFGFGYNNIVAFSGTDDTIVGWEENFNLVTGVTQGQIAAVNYLAQNLVNKKNNFCVGHSKGGNLALYAFLHGTKKTAQRLQQCLCVDGPGVAESDFDTPIFAEFGEKILSLAPQCSIIGRLFCHKERFFVTESNQEAMYQHDCFSWQILGTRFLEHIDGFTEMSNKIEELVRKILFNMTAAQKRSFVKSVFDILYQTDSQTLTDLDQKRAAILAAYIKMERKDKRVLHYVFGKLIAEPSARKLFLSNLKQMRLTKIDTLKKQMQLSQEISSRETNQEEKVEQE